MRCSLGNLPNRSSVLASDWLTGCPVYCVGRRGLGGQSWAGFCRDQTCCGMLRDQDMEIADVNVYNVESQREY